MSVKTVIGLADQLAVKSLFADTRFISCNQEDRLALRVEGKGNSPLTIGRAEPQLLHVCVARVVQRVNAGPSQLRPKLLQQAVNARRSVRTSLCSSSNSGSNSSPISTTQLTLVI